MDGRRWASFHVLLLSPETVVFGARDWRSLVRATTGEINISMISLVKGVMGWRMEGVYARSEKVEREMLYGRSGRIVYGNAWARCYITQMDLGK